MLGFGGATTVLGGAITVLGGAITVLGGAITVLGGAITVLSGAITVLGGARALQETSADRYSAARRARRWEAQFYPEPFAVPHRAEGAPSTDQRS